MSKKELQNNNLEEVKLKDTQNNNLAIMINEGSGEYIQSSNQEFPTEGYQYNAEKSGCINNDGAKIDDALVYDQDNKQIKFITNQTGYCYIYFDKVVSFSALDLVSKKPVNLNTTLEGGLYRYQGTADAVTNNYICFGTNDKDTCTSDTDKYMYRIIGINESGQFKLIKKEALNNKTVYKWYNSYSSNVAWNNSYLYKGLNGISGGEYSNLFIGNTTYIPNDTWKNKIADTTWKYGDTGDDINKMASALYNVENGWSTTVNAKIGLMYAHDYYYALKSGGENCGEGSGNESVCKTSWLYSTMYEWTMSRLGYHSANNIYLVWRMTVNGFIYHDYLSDDNCVRPVFFLENTVQISGDGTLTSPYVITN